MFGFLNDWGKEKATDEKQSTPNPTHTRGGPNNEESKSSRSQSSHEDIISNEEFFMVKNPLVLLICCSQYEGGWANLPGVRTDHKILYELFHDFYGWRVDSIHEKVTKSSILDFLDSHKADIVKSKEKC